MPAEVKTLGRQALSELGSVFDRIGTEALDGLVDAVCGARRIALHGLGREGLMMRALAMRLYHLGLDAHVVGEMTTPPLAGGDFLLVSCGPGRLATSDALIGVAREAGARIGVITAQPEGPTSKLADVLIFLPAQTMADDRAIDAAPKSLLPMGSLFELGQLLFFELVVLALRDRLGETAESMRARHTNLE